jgi:hypothetical protein
MCSLEVDDVEVHGAGPRLAGLQLDGRADLRLLQAAELPGVKKEMKRREDMIRGE